MKSGKISPILFVALGVAVGLFGFFLILANPYGWKLSLPSIIKSPSDTANLPKGVASAPTPYLFLPQGKQTYNARGAAGKRSAAVSITYNPLDPQKNTNQTISATIESKETVSSVNLTVNTDKQKNIHVMKLISGTKTNGVWETTYKVTDTYEKVYNVSFEIITELGNKTVQPMFIR
jgi:hypothetical protein